MFKLFKTIASIISCKTRKANRSLQITNCIDLIEDQQYKLANNYKKLVKSINELKNKLDELKVKKTNTNDANIIAVIDKNISIVDSTINRLNANKELIIQKIKKSEDSRVVLKAKKELLDSIESIKGLSTNVFEGEDFDVDAIMSEIDKQIQDIESEIQANDELNTIVK